MRFGQIRLWALAVLIFADEGNLFASCLDIQFSDPSNMHLEADEVLVVTHPSSVWDPRSSAKAGVDFTMQQAKKANYPTIVLQHKIESTYYQADCSPSFYVQSQSGEFSFGIKASTVHLAGGQFQQCFRTSLREISRQLAEKSRDARVHIFAEAVYATAQYFPQDAYPKFSQFSQLVGQGPSYTPIYFTLGQILRILESPTRQLDLLEAFLRDTAFYSTLDAKIWSNFNVRLILDQKHVRDLQVVEGRPSFTVVVDSKFEPKFP